MSPTLTTGEDWNSVPMFTSGHVEGIGIEDSEPKQDKDHFHRERTSINKISIEELNIVLLKSGNYNGEE